MKSQLAAYLNLHNHPVALCKAAQPPEGGRSFPPGQRGCVISLLAAAAGGETTWVSRDTVSCVGGRVGTGFCAPDPEQMGLHLSAGGPAVGGLFYKQTPELAQCYVRQLPGIAAGQVLVMKPLDDVAPEEPVEAVVFLVAPDQLSGLVTLASYDQPVQDTVQIKFGAGCVQALLYPLADGEAGRNTCTIGLTDPSARRWVGREELSFALPYARFLELEEKAAESFLSKGIWQWVRDRT